MPPRFTVVAVLAGLCALAAPAAVPGAAEAAATRTAVVRIGSTPEGRHLVARHQWRETGGRRVLVVGTVNGTSRPGRRVVQALRRQAVPAGLDLWTVRTANPDGVVAHRRRTHRGVVVDRDFPLPGGVAVTSAGTRAAARAPETRALIAFVRDLRPDVVVVLDSGRPGVAAAGQHALAQRVARAGGLRLRSGRGCAAGCPGSFARWARGPADLVVRVTLAPGRPRQVQRALRAVRTLAQTRTDGSTGPAGTGTVPGSGTGAAPAPATGDSTGTVQPTRRRTPAPPAVTPTPAPTVGVPAPKPASGGPFLAYAADSYFRSRFGGQGVDVAATATFRAFMRTHPDQRGTPYPVIRGVGANKWGTAYAEGGATDPVWRLTGSLPAELGVLRTVGVHAPEWLGTVLTGTSDSPFVVVDRANGWTVWGAKATVVGDHLISVGAAGLFEHASNGLDRRNPLSDSRLNLRSRGAIPDAMVIRRDLVDWGISHQGDLGHVLHLFFVETDSAAGFRSPMVGTESGKTGWGAEGTRIAIDPSVDLEARGLSPAALVVARTLQRYGAYLGDNAGGATSLKAEQETTGHPVWSGSLRADSLSALTWDDFVVVAG